MKARSIIIAFLALACLWLAGTRHATLVAMRAEHRLDAFAPLENAPPLMTFTTVVLGGFRGILSDILWLRISHLQDRGRYIEVVQLSDWVTKLEPHATAVWDFHSWNMAYNISVMMPDPEDRWRWVRSGLHLLRDEGLLYNPGDPRLYSTLGWLYQHKIAGTSDAAHLYYKARLAEEMTELFGGGRPDYGALSAEALRAMRDVHKLDPAIMQTLDELYGPLDWRRAETHALYWAYRGLQVAGDREAEACKRMISQCLEALTGVPSPGTEERRGP